MIRLLIARFYSYIFGLFHDYLHYNIRGLGYLLRLINRHAIINIKGKHMFLNYNVSSSYTRLINGNWAEPETHVFLNNVIQSVDDALFVDVGANVGEMILDVASLNNVNSVYAFEPINVCADVMRINNILNGFNNVNIYEMALSDTEGEFFMESDGTPQSQVITNKSDYSDKNLVPIKVTTLDNIYNTTIKDDIADAITIILIDVEGHECKVLSGAKEMIESAMPLIIFEYNNISKKHFSLDDIRKLLPSYYEIYRLNRLGKLDNDLINTCNCVAVSSKSKYYNNVITQKF